MYAVFNSLSVFKLSVTSKLFSKISCQSKSSRISYVLVVKLSISQNRNRDSGISSVSDWTSRRPKLILLPHLSETQIVSLGLFSKASINSDIWILTGRSPPLNTSFR